MSARALRILHVTDRLSARGGADWHLLGVLERQEQDRGCEVRLAVARDDGTAPCPCALHVLPELDEEEGDGPGLRALTEAFRPDVLHLHNLLNPRVMDWASGFPCVMTIQDHRAFCPGRGKVTLDDERCTRPMDAEQCRRCFSSSSTYERRLSVTRRRLDALKRFQVVVLSRYMKRELVAVGLSADRVHVVPPFVHRLPEAPPAERDCVLVAGRLVHAKGVFDALEAHRRSGVDLPLVFAGTGSLRNELEDRGCRVTGWLSHEELVGWYARARALIFAPRWQEPFGIAGIEAMHFGVPVVAWDSGGIPEWHPGHPPLTPWGNVDALAASLKTALSETLNWRDPYEPEALMAQLANVYREAQ